MAVGRWLKTFPRSFQSGVAGLLGRHSGRRAGLRGDAGASPGYSPGANSYFRRSVVFGIPVNLRAGVSSICCCSRTRQHDIRERFDE